MLSSVSSHGGVPTPRRPASAPAAAALGDRFQPSSPDESPSGPGLRALIQANAFPQSRSAPSGKARAFVEGGLKVRDGDGQVRQLLDKAPSSFQWLDKDTLLVQADQEGNEKYRLMLVRADGQPWEGTSSCALPLGVAGAGSQELCFREDSRIFYRSDARSPGDFDLHVFDINTRQSSPVFQGQGDMDYDQLAPDGRMLACRNDSNTTSSLSLIDPQTGQLQDLTPRGEAKYRPLRFLDDHQLLVLSNQDREFSAPFVIDTRTGQRTLLADTPRDTEQLAFSPDKSKLACVVNDQGYSQLRLYDLASKSELPAPALPEGVVYQFSYKDDSHVRFSMSSADAPNRSGELDLRSGEVRWTRADDVSGLGLVKPELVHYASADGTEIPAFLYRPPGADPDKPLPGVIQLHGGPDSQSRPRFDPMIQHLVDQGVQVLVPNVRGSTGYGRTYLDADNGPQRLQAIQDVKYGAEFLKKMGADPHRIALMGQSYGGYLALSALAFLSGEKWAAAVDHAGPSNLETVTADPSHDPYRAEFGQDPSVLRQLSPIHQADNIQAPLLVIHGANDPQVSPTESEQMVQALQARGHEVEYKILAHEGHIIRDTETKIEAQLLMSDFLIRHLKP